MSRAFAVVLALSLAGVARGAEIPPAARAILEKADQIEVYSLDPNPSKDAKEAFHQYPVLGKVVVKDDKTRKALVAALMEGARENEGYTKFCFDPRHGIRATVDGKSLDLVICFQCLQVHGYLGAKEDAGFATTGSPEPTLDRILTAAGVKLAPKPVKPKLKESPK